MSKAQYRYPDYRIIQYAKAPQRGQVKTRLRPALGDDGCLQLHRRLVEHCFRQLSGAHTAPYSFSISGDSNGYFERLVAGTDVTIQQQQGADLGQRMQHSAKQALAAAEAVVIVGSDCPFMDGDYLQQACKALQQGHDCVLGPATDGGYVLIGLQRVDRQLFEGIAWGSDQVLAQTRQRLDDLGWRYCELPELADIDRPQDLVQLDSIWPGFRL
ncbi:TIGR04282 family arsenosugar biosynthesis glycosyltransferase [Porticoccus sp. W117]|uniref:TIGR04282 family arsenosugar biosynthesis glycosyltransferase n=1 Tax=Porticoccus sp. W117 TaxID=3054777 RepID=UPI002599EE39|nr:TIGR04282 family arsenosugar biosynthesis glycosyltransferase [Porticoccus sp. W117]MDM3869785.1 TIGR04282 family arsenosugar biosynthesis glycosyltransferase [Porticoccus sp. W117]